MARPARSTGVSGIAVTAGALGLFAVYAGIRDVPLLEGLRAALKGEDPSTRSRSPNAPYAGPTPPEAAGASSSSSSSAVFGGPVRVDATTRVRAYPGTIQVHKDIAADVQALLDAAHAAGINLGGSGWRSPLDQRLLRLRHGYTSDSQPSGSGGRIPTAVPGSSRHEAGLAIDFTTGGRTIRKDSAAFRWLAANAGRYGLRNLPSEAWHWSVDGK